MCPICFSRWFYFQIWSLTSSLHSRVSGILESIFFFKLFHFASFISLFISVQSLVWIAIDRCVAMVFPIKLGLVFIKMRTKAVQRFHSIGQHTCKFMRTKISVYIGKYFNSHRIGLVHQHGRRVSLFWNTNMTAMTLYSLHVDLSKRCLYFIAGNFETY